MNQALMLAALACALSGCAVEGIGFDGRVDAYHNAARDGNEFVALHPGIRETVWYEGWCAAELPHFKRMDDQYARVTRYCDAMKAQPEHAAEIRKSLIDDMQSGSVQANQRRNGALAVLGAIAATQAAPKPAPVTCTSTAFGTSATTTCY
jgi:hypothetical protein